jgi:nicotinamidase-related amidase
MADGLKSALSPQALHLCIDMQRLFAEDTAWRTPWMNRVLPKVVEICAAHPDRNWFTRFIPPASPDETEGVWREYWIKWRAMTLNQIGEEMVDLIEELRPFAARGRVFDKRLYSPWLDPELEAAIRGQGVDTLIITGAETDVCVLATVLGGVDRGLRIIVVTDALCSSSDESHDALIDLYGRRYSAQIETVDTATLLANWP